MFPSDGSLPLFVLRILIRIPQYSSYSLEKVRSADESMLSRAALIVMPEKKVLSPLADTVSLCVTHAAAPILGSISCLGWPDYWCAPPFLLGRFESMSL